MEVTRGFQVIEVSVNKRGIKRLIKPMSIFNDVNKAQGEINKLNRIYPNRIFEIRVLK